MKSTETSITVTFATDGGRPVALEKQLQLRGLLDVKLLLKLHLHGDVHFAKAQTILALADDLCGSAQLLSQLPGLLRGWIV